jgi:hypothetical protein
MVRFQGGQPARSAWYDRNPTTKVYNFYQTQGPHAITQNWAYTVPAGKKAIVELAQLKIKRSTTPSPMGAVYACIKVTPSGGSIATVLYADLLVGTAAIGDADSAQLQGTLALSTGDMIQAADVDSSTGGTVEYSETMKVTEFDA